MNSIHKWRFDPGKRAGKEVAMDVNIPVRFTSLKQAVPAVPKTQPMKNMSDAVAAAAQRQHHPAITVSCWISADGKVEGDPKAAANSAIPEADFKILAAYAESCVKSWTFTPAVNPDGAAVPGDALITVQL